jgi:hypothetical protein
MGNDAVKACHPGVFASNMRNPLEIGKLSFC